MLVPFTQFLIITTCVIFCYKLQKEPTYFCTINSIATLPTLVPVRVLHFGIFEGHNLLKQLEFSQVFRWGSAGQLSKKCAKKH